MSKVTTFDATTGAAMVSAIQSALASVASTNVLALQIDRQGWDPYVLHCRVTLFITANDGVTPLVLNGGP